MRETICSFHGRLSPQSDAEITGGFRADAINAIRASALHAARGEFNAAIYVA